MINIFLFSQEPRYYSGIHIFGGYNFIGYNEIDNPDSENIYYKYSYPTASITKIETQKKGKTMDLFFSLPAIIEIDKSDDNIIAITFKNKLNIPAKYQGIDTCVIKIVKVNKELRGEFYADGKRIFDASGRYEVIYRFNENNLLEWQNYDTSGKLKNIKGEEYAKCSYTYTINNKIENELFYNQNNNQSEMKGIDWSHVECGSPGPETYFNYSRIKYCYTSQNLLLKKEYYNKKNILVHTQIIYY